MVRARRLSFQGLGGQKIKQSKVTAGDVTARSSSIVRRVVNYDDDDARHVEGLVFGDKAVDAGLSSGEQTMKLVINRREGGGITISFSGGDGLP